jgi:hypothetical protein
VSGLTTDQARAITEPLGLLLVLDGEKIPDADKVQTGARCSSKSRSRAHALTHGGEVHAFIAIPPQLSTVPALVGQVVAAAEQQLQVAGLRLGDRDRRSLGDDSTGSGHLDAASGRREAAQERGGELGGLQGAGAESKCPSLRGRTLGGARQMLEQLGSCARRCSQGHRRQRRRWCGAAPKSSGRYEGAKGQKVDLVVND